jgi:hypothetical protein
MGVQTTGKGTRVKTNNKTLHNFLKINQILTKNLKKIMAILGKSNEFCIRNGSCSGYRRSSFLKVHA